MKSKVREVIGVPKCPDCGEVMDNLIERKIKVVVSGLAATGKTFITYALVHGYLPPVSIRNEINMDRREPIFWETHTCIVRSDDKKAQLKIKILNLAGQTPLLEEFTTIYAQRLFQETTVLFYVIDITDLSYLPLAQEFLNKEIICIRNFSTQTPLICILFHKTDLIPKEILSEVIQFSKQFISDGLVKNYRDCLYFCTSIYDSSLFHALNEVLELLMHRISFPGNLKDLKLGLWGKPFGGRIEYIQFDLDSEDEITRLRNRESKQRLRSFLDPATRPISLSPLWRSDQLMIQDLMDRGYLLDWEEFYHKDQKYVDQEKKEIISKMKKIMKELKSA